MKGIEAKSAKSAQDSVPWVALRISFSDSSIFLGVRKPRAVKWFFTPVLDAR